MRLACGLAVGPCELWGTVIWCEGKDGYNAGGALHSHMLQGTPYTSRQLAGIDWLGYEIQRPQFKDAPAGALLMMRAQDDDGGAGRIAMQRLQHSDRIIYLSWH